MNTIVPHLVYRPDDKIAVCVGDRLIVAVVGHAYDWAAYAGPADWPEWRVAERGDKISRENAEFLFPALVAAGLEWRY